MSTVYRGYGKIKVFDYFNISLINVRARTRWIYNDVSITIDTELIKNVTMVKCGFAKCEIMQCIVIPVLVNAVTRNYTRVTAPGAGVLNLNLNI